MYSKTTVLVFSWRGSLVQLVIVTYELKAFVNHPTRRSDQLTLLYIGWPEIKGRQGVKSVNKNVFFSIAPLIQLWLKGRVGRSHDA